MSLRTTLFATSGRRIITFVVANAIFFSAGMGIHQYIDLHATSPGLTFVLVALWMAMGVGTALLSVIALGNVIIYRGFVDSFIKDEMAELDARIDQVGGSIVELPDDDDLLVPSADGGVRFWMFFILLAVANLLVANQISNSFLQRYTHPGIAVVHMRSPDPAMRRQGLNMLASRLDFTVTQAVRDVVQVALADPDEGVAARAAFVIGTLGIDEAAPKLGEVVRTRPALAFAAMISIAQIGALPKRAKKARLVARALAADPTALTEPHALTLMLGMLRVPDIQRLREMAQSKEEPIRVAAIWALGRLGDPQVLSVLAAALTDDALAVRCAAIRALERLVVFESSEPLRKAFEANTDALLMCPEVLLPVQEDGAPTAIVRYRNYELALVHALATTDDPALMPWLVKHQEGRDYRTNKLMKKLWESLREKNRSGQLNGLKARIRLNKIQEVQAAPDAGASDAQPENDQGIRDAGTP